MNEEDRKKIKKNLEFLQKRLKIDERFQRLVVEKNIFSQVMIDNILEERSPSLDLCMKLMMSGPKAFQKFLEALVETDQFEVVQNLEPGLDVQSSAHGSAKSDKMVLNEDGNSSPDLPLNLASVQQPIREQLDDLIEEISDKIDSIGFEKSAHQPTIAHAPTTKDDPRYNMGHSKRGKAIIFNHKYFAAGLSSRDGTNVDRDVLSQTLSELGFEVSCYNDPTLNKIESVLRTLSYEDHSDRDTLMITVLSHGEAGMLYAYDTFYKPEKLWSSFTADRCPTLAGKPKLFFIQVSSPGAT